MTPCTAERASGPVALADARAFLVVARGQRGLLTAVREIVAALDWVEVIEDRRRAPSLLPRGGGEPGVSLRAGAWPNDWAGTTTTTTRSMRRERPLTEAVEPV